MRFCGYSADPREHYATASIFCLTSAFEGVGHGIGGSYGVRRCAHGI